MRVAMGGIASLLVALASAVRAQEVAPYDGLRAGQDAYQAAEEERRQRLDDQLYLNDAMRTRYGWAPAARGSVIWYGNAGLGYGRPLGLDYAYAYSSERLLRRRGAGLYIERYWSPPLTVFEPWPYIPGDIYGYYFPPYVRQSIGQRQIQTGPNRWESHPIYPEDLEATPVPASEPATEPSPPKRDDDKVERPTEKKSHRRAF